MTKLVLSDETEFILTVNSWSLSDTALNIIIPAENTIEEIREIFSDTRQMFLYYEDQEISLVDFNNLTQISLIMDYYFERNGETVQGDAWSISLIKFIQEGD